ncbi:MAG: hypothetical protein FJY48_08065 [Betaproteobacteria bacterium]|nr:hypothetical protein [Betaproteobacteria bacterium]
MWLSSNSNLRCVLCAVFLMQLSGATFAASRSYCDSAATNAESFTEERKKGFTKNQVKENARIIAQQRDLDQTVLEAWYAEIEWVFSSAQKRYNPSASRQRRYDECLASER